MGDFEQGRQAIVDRLKKRLNYYRAHSIANHNHLEATASAIYSDENKQTALLKQRFIESKSKKNSKKSDHRKQDSSSNSSLSTVNVSR